MAKKKEKLSPIPKPAKRRAVPAQADRDGSGFSAVVELSQNAIDLSYIADDLRPLAVPVASLDFLPGNPRKHAERDLAQLRASLKNFRQLKNIVVNTAKTPPQVVAGNGTLQAALALGWSHVAVVRQKMTDAESAAFAVADNQTALASAWDDAALVAMMEGLKADDAGAALLQEAGLAEMFADLEKAFAEKPPDDPDPETPPATEPEKLGVLVECRDEGHQQQVLTALAEQNETGRAFAFTEKVNLALRAA